MRFLHTADWHLGRVFFGAHLIEDQSCALGELSHLMRERRTECLVISGDLYDRSVPPVEAVELLDEFLYRTVIEDRIRVVMIAGNHDGAERLAFGSRLLGEKGLVIGTRLAPEPVSVTLEDKWGAVRIAALPYFEPARARSELEEPEVRSHAEAMAAVLRRVRNRNTGRVRTILAAHCFVDGGLGSESERPLAIGGVESVPVSLFEGFEYVALGHLHRPQQFADGTVQYSGSLLRYSFSEVDHEKTVNAVEMDREGRCRVERVALPQRRRLRKIRGLFDGILTAARDDSARDDYLLVELLDEAPVFEAMRRLRELYPNTLHIERPAVSRTGPAELHRDHRKVDTLELFSSFYRYATGSELSASQRSAFVSVCDSLRRKEQEVPV